MQLAIRSSVARFLALAGSRLTTIPSVWYVLDYENDVDPELPAVVRPTFNRYPPAAYRFAEAGDTIDHVAVYVSSAALVLAAWGWFRNARSPRLGRGDGFFGGRILARRHAGAAGRRLVRPGLADHLRCTCSSRQPPHPGRVWPWGSRRSSSGPLSNGRCDRSG